jgi:heptosyltransferase-3
MSSVDHQHPPDSILVITLRRLGDVLLTTPLIRTIRRGYPRAKLHVLVFRGSEPILSGNPDIDRVITTAERPSGGEMFALARSLGQRYDLAVSTQVGDRPTIFALLAGRRRAALVPRPGETGSWWKRRAHHVSITPEPDTHRVTQLLALGVALGLEPVSEVVCPRGAPAGETGLRQPYAVLHPNPFYRYKRWTVGGWRRLVGELVRRGLAVAVTGGSSPVETKYLDDLWSDLDQPVQRLDGRLDWPRLTALMAGARVYVGPDTSMTHLAAASGCPTIALYGPTSPRLIGPWPIGGLATAWDHAGTVQRRGNVWVVQNPLPCLPCEKLGCDGHLESRSQCLDELPVRQVLAAVDQALSSPR